jgi:Aminotransferase class-V
MTQFPIAEIRASFPALSQGEDFVFFDNAAGAQISRSLDAVNQHLLTRNVQRGGPYRKSKEVDATIARARESVALFLNAGEANEVAFGMNATSFIRLVSLAIGQTLGERCEIIVTDMDHEANVAAWLALEREGAKFLWWRMRDDGNLHVADVEPLLSSRTRLLACTVASNAIGSAVEVAEVARLAHAVGAEVFSTACITVPTDPSTCRHSAAIIWSAPGTRHLPLIWAFSGVDWKRCARCPLSASTSFLIRRRSKSRLALSFTKTSQVWMRQSPTWKAWVEAWLRLRTMCRIPGERTSCTPWKRSALTKRLFPSSS